MVKLIEVPEPPLSGCGHRTAGPAVVARCAMSAEQSSDLGADQPFPGLRPYAFADAKWFCGRETQTSALYTLVERNHFTAVVGSSGSGKSSLVRAGLLPVLETETSEVGGKSWACFEMRPGEAPMARLAEALAGHQHLARMRIRPNRRSAQGCSKLNPIPAASAPASASLTPGGS